MRTPSQKTFKPRFFSVLSLLSSALLAALPNMNAQALSLDVSSLPRAMSISARTSSQLSMDTIESVSMEHKFTGMNAGAELRFLAGTGQWYNTQLSAHWTLRAPYLSQQLRASMVLSRFSGQYEGYSNASLPSDEISHMSSFALNYASRQSLPFVRTGFSMIYQAGLQYSNFDLHLAPQGATQIPSLQTGMTRMELGAFAQQDFPIRPYIHATAFGGFSLAYRYLNSGTSTAIGGAEGQFNLASQYFLENRVIAGIEVEYRDLNLLPALHLSARFSMGFRLNGPAISDVYTQKDGKNLQRVHFNFGGDNVVDEQLSLRGSYQVMPNFTVGADWSLFYQGNFGTAIAFRAAYQF